MALAFFGLPCHQHHPVPDAIPSLFFFPFPLDRGVSQVCKFSDRSFFAEVFLPKFFCRSFFAEVFSKQVMSRVSLHSSGDSESSGVSSLHSRPTKLFFAGCADLPCLGRGRQQILNRRKAALATHLSLRAPDVSRITRPWKPQCFRRVAKRPPVRQP